jgi:hypothetical protein
MQRRRWVWGEGWQKYQTAVDNSTQPPPSALSKKGIGRGRSKQRLGIGGGNFFTGGNTLHPGAGARLAQQARGALGQGHCDVRMSHIERWEPQWKRAVKPVPQGWSFGVAFPFHFRACMRRQGDKADLCVWALYAPGSDNSAALGAFTSRGPGLGSPGCRAGPRPGVYQPAAARVRRRQIGADSSLPRQDLAPAPIPSRRCIPSCSQNDARAAQRRLRQPGRR